MSNIVEKVKRARDRIANKKNWCRDALALDKTNRPVWPTQHYAVKWCATGSLMLEFNYADDIPDSLAYPVGLPDIKVLSDINDNLGHEAVISFINNWIIEHDKA
jgi:hypothetical protein